MRALIAVAAVVAALVLGVPATADAAATVTIDAPADGSTHPAPYTGPVSVTFSDVDGSTYGVSVTGPDSYTWSTTLTPETDGTHDLGIDPASNAGTYVVSVVDQAGAVLASATISVTKPNEAVVVTPEPGSAQQPGYAGPVSVSWTSVSNVGHAYGVAVEVAGTTVVSCSLPGLGLEGTTTQCATGVLAPGQYTIAVTDETAGERITDTVFRVLAPPPAPEIRLLGVAVSPRSFYPLRRDGYRDRTTVSFLTNLAARVNITVRDRRGHVVRRARLGTVSGDRRHTWRWGGTASSGRRVDPGSYRIQVTARRDGRRVRRAVTVRVRTGWTVRRGAKAIWGRNYSSIARSGNCAKRFSRRSLVMACVGRGSIVATYRFRLPRRTVRIAGYRGAFAHGVYVGRASRVVLNHHRRGKRGFEINVGIAQRAGRTGVVMVGATITYRYRVRI